MLRQKTVFIIGAGAGVEIKMPLGSDLASKISAALNIQYAPNRPRKIGGQPYTGDEVLHECFMKHDLGWEACIKVAAKISAGISFAPSIDDFLHLHKADRNAVEVGKIAIVRSILAAESGSDLMAGPDGRISTSKLEKAWFMRLIKRLSSVGKEDPFAIFDNSTFITFNYDRTLEHFLGHAVSQLYGIPPQRAWTVVRKAKIFHPYGAVGKLPGLAENGENGTVEFGAVAASAMSRLAGGIQTYTEQLEDKKLQDDIQIAMSEAEAVVFLGFGFHKQNMNLLRASNNVPEVRIYGTAKNVSPDDREVIGAEIAALFPSTSLPSERFVKLQDSGCAGLFDHYHFSF